MPKLFSALALALALVSPLATQENAVSATGISLKKPVFGGACRVCPRGAMAQVVKDAMQFYGYQVQICHNCNSAAAPVIVSQAKLPPYWKDPAVSVAMAPPNAPGFGPVDFGATPVQFHYQKHDVYSGPTLKSVQHLPAAIRLRFDGGLVAKGGKLEGFSIAGEDHKFYWAEARIKGNSVLVSSPSVLHPVAVRYAWQSDPAATLFSGAGLPASPFRTYDWPLITQAVRPY